MQFHAFEAYAAEVGVTAAVTPVEQNSDYEPGIAQIRGEAWHIRTARTTPTKPGAFVAFWRRDVNGTTIPFGAVDLGAGLLVFVDQADGRGVFRFTAGELLELGVASGKRQGKRGFRVYPSWCTGLNPQATATQRAQASAFREY